MKPCIVKITDRLYIDKTKVDTVFDDNGNRTGITFAGGEHYVKLPIKDVLRLIGWIE